MGEAWPTVGVLALQGDVIEHLHALGDLAVRSMVVRNARDVARVDALIIPGGESTTVIRLLERFEMIDPIVERARAGMAVWGTCMGMIVAAREVVDLEQKTLDLIDISVRRNAFGRQIASAEIAMSIPVLGGRAVSGDFHSCALDRADRFRCRSLGAARRTRGLRSSGQGHGDGLPSRALPRSSRARIFCPYDLHIPLVQEIFTQERSSPMKPPLDGLTRQSEHRADFVDRHLLEIA